MERNLQVYSKTDFRQPAKSKSTRFGLKELASGKDPDVDIVALHGIDGDREDSWTADNGVLWLRDLLPEIVPNARILTYGYDGNTHGQEQLATDFMHEHAMNFIAKLALFRETTSTAQRPIIFVAHGSGGLLLKSALIHGHLCHDGHLKHHRAISQSTHGVAFFGTPHQGSTELARSILGSGSNSSPTANAFQQHFEKDSEALQQQLVHYLAISERFETKFFYETYGTHVGGVSKKVVPRTSAVVPGAVNAEAIGIHKDHIHMVRFPSPDDEDFWTVSIALSLMSRTACQKVAEKRNRYKEPILTPSQQIALPDLLHVNAARFDASSRPHCLEGTREELLKTIAQWTEQPGGISREGRRMFWLSGQAGTGKTTISLSVARDCRAKGQLGASFFFSRDHADRSELRLVFPSIAHQLGIFHKPFKHSLAEALEQDPDLVAMDPMYQFEKLIKDPVKSCDLFPAATIVVIDALDECKDENPISRILSILSSHIHELPCLKFFITSRPEDHIRGGFDPLSSVTQTVILHNLEAGVVDADIERYLRNALSTTAPRLYPALVKPGWISDESIKSLVGKAGSLFIFAATAMNFILDRNYSDPPRQLAILLGKSTIVETSSSSPFAFLDQLYLQVLRQAFPSGTTPPHRLTLLRKLLGAIILIRDPLSPGALESLLNLVSGEARTTLRHLHSIIVIPTTEREFIRLIHPSFFDFATSRCLDSTFRIDSLECHEQLAIACFKQMKGLKRDICRIQDASKLNSEIKDLTERIERCIPPAIQYACRHWSYHLCIAGGNTLQGMLREFCREQILYWIEALSLLGYLQEGIRHLQDVSMFLNTSSVPSKDLLEVLSDSTRFMADHFELISRASLQLYRSALPLSATSSFLPKTFHHELSGGMRVLQGEWAQKSSGMTLLRGSKSTVQSVNFSPDGRLIVSSSTNEVRLWDPGTGTLLRKLDVEPNSFVTFARFFPDARQVIVGTNNGTILIWNVGTGDCLQTTRLWGVGSQKTLACCDISANLTHIVGSLRDESHVEDGNIYVWHAPDGDLLKTLSGHRYRINSVAFSPDHKLIASVSSDKTFFIWNALNFTRLRTLPITHSGPVKTIAFSPDSKYIVSGSRFDIFLWDASSGVALKTLKGRIFSVCSMAFSPDGAYIISGSEDNILRVWEATSGEVFKSIRCSGVVTNVGFSPDGTQYIRSTDETIYIQDADSASNLNELEEWQFTLVRLSLHEACITGEIRTRRIEHIWSGPTYTRSISIDSHIHVTISPNNEYLLYIENLRDFWLWEVASRTTLWKNTSSVSFSLTFSSDSTRLIMASFGTIQILDVASGNNLFTVRHLYSNTSASFSADGSQIVSGHLKYDIPPHVRPLPVPDIDEPSERLKYSIEGEWIFASNGTEKERCVWIPQDWRTSWVLEENYSLSYGRVALGTRRGLVLLDLSCINLSI